MTEEERRKVVTEQPAASGSESRLTSSRTVESRPSGGELARRVVVLIFGLIQILIALRFVLLLLNAREGNSIVKGILDLSQLFVAPFEGILRTDALHASGSTLDITAIVAFVGWTILELIVIWAISIFRREPT
jgi:YGGT family